MTDGSRWLFLGAKTRSGWNMLAGIGRGGYQCGVFGHLSTGLERVGRYVAQIISE